MLRGVAGLRSVLRALRALRGLLLRGVLPTAEEALDELAHPLEKVLLAALGALLRARTARALRAAGCRRGVHLRNDAELRAGAVACVEGGALNARALNLVGIARLEIGAVGTRHRHGHAALALHHGRAAGHDGHALAVFIHDLAACLHVQVRHGAIAGHGPGGIRPDVDCQGCVAYGLVRCGVLRDGGRARPGATVEQIDRGSRNVVCCRIACGVLLFQGEVHGRAVGAGRAPAVRVVALGLDKVHLRAVEVERRLGDDDVCARVGEVEHAAGVDRRRKRRAQCLEAGRIAGRRVGIARGGLVDDDAVFHRVAARDGVVGARQLRVLDVDAVLALHAGYLATGRRARHAVNLDVAGGIEQRAARTCRGKRTAGHRDRPAAAVGGD